MAVHRTHYLGRTLSFLYFVHGTRFLTVDDRTFVTNIGGMSDQESGPASRKLDIKSKNKGKYRSKRGKALPHEWDWSNGALAPDPEQSIDKPSEELIFAGKSSLDNNLGPAPFPAVSEALEPVCLPDILKGEPPQTSTPPINSLPVSGTASIDNASISSSGVSECSNPRQGQFQSNLFKIRVGPKKEQFLAHSHILSKSPKLDAQCNGKFPEAGSRKIILPDHDPKIFALVLEYLYGGDYFPFLKEEFDNIRSVKKDVRATQLQREGDLYCMAEYYQLDELQDLAVRKMKMLTPVTFESFLSVSEYVYSHCGTRGAFHDYFKEQIMKALPLVVHEEWLLDVVAKGGDLARDLFLSGRDLPQEAADDDFDDEAAVMVKWEDNV